MRAVLIRLIFCLFFHFSTLLNHKMPLISLAYAKESENQLALSILNQVSYLLIADNNGIPSYLNTFLDYALLHLHQAEEAEEAEKQDRGKAQQMKGIAIAYIEYYSAVMNDPYNGDVDWQESIQNPQEPLSFQNSQNWEMPEYEGKNQAQLGKNAFQRMMIRIQEFSKSLKPESQVKSASFAKKRTPKVLAKAGGLANFNVSLKSSKQQTSRDLTQPMTTDLTHHANTFLKSYEFPAKLAALIEAVSHFSENLPISYQDFTKVLKLHLFDVLYNVAQYWQETHEALDFKIIFAHKPIVQKLTLEERHAALQNALYNWEKVQALANLLALLANRNI